MATNFNLIVKDEEGLWKPVREGYLGLGGKCGFSLKTQEDEYKLSLKPTSVGIKKLVLVDPAITDEEERVMESESSVIYGIANLMAKKHLKA